MNIGSGDRLSVSLFALLECLPVYRFICLSGNSHVRPVLGGHLYLPLNLLTVCDTLFCFGYIIIVGIMTSPNGNIFYVTGSLCGEFIGNRWIFLTKASDVELWFSLMRPWTNDLANSPYAGDLRRHRDHCDVIVMFAYVRVGDVPGWFLTIWLYFITCIVLLSSWTFIHVMTLHYIYCTSSASSTCLLANIACY